MSDPGLTEPSLTAGLLMEGAQSQQQLAAAALVELRRHTDGLDAVVRDEIHRTLVAALASVSAEVEQVTRRLERVGRASHWRAALLGIALAGAGLAPIGAARWWLPTPASVEALRSQQARLETTVARLARQGGHVQLRECGAALRLCARIDTRSARFGEDGDFAVLAGY